MPSSVAWALVAWVGTQSAPQEESRLVPPPGPIRAFESGGLFFVAPFDQCFVFPITLGFQIGGGYHFRPNPDRGFMASTALAFGYAGMLCDPESFDDPASDKYSVLRLAFQARIGGGRYGRFGYFLIGGGGLYARRHELSSYEPTNSGGGFGMIGGGYQRKIGRHMFIGIESDIFYGSHEPELVDDDSLIGLLYAGMGLTGLLGWII